MEKEKAGVPCAGTCLLVHVGADLFKCLIKMIGFEFFGDT